MSERARSLLLRLDQQRQDNYGEVKTLLLNEFLLTPFQFKSRFDNAKRLNDETWTLYCTRLHNLLEYYCHSRTVERDFDRLCSLLVADRIKATLPQSCLNFILSAESNDPKLAFSCDKIASMADIYHTTHTYDGKPKVAGAENDTRVMFNGGNKGPVNNQVTNANRASSDTQVKTFSSKPFNTGANTPVSTNLRCFNCNQFGHKRQQCPNRTQGNSSYSARKVITSARVQAYSIDDTVTPVTSDVDSDKGNYRSSRDVIESHDEGARKSNVDGTMPRLSCKANVESVSRDAHSSEIKSNTDSNISQNVCSSAVMAESFLSPQSIADNIAT